MIFFHPRGNPARLTSISAGFPQLFSTLSPSPRVSRGFRGIPAIPISVHISTSNHACVPPPLNYLQFRAIIFDSAHVLIAFLLPRPGTHSHRMSVNDHLLLVFETISKHTVSVLPSPPSDTKPTCASILTGLRRFTNHLLTSLLTYFSPTPIHNPHPHMSQGKVCHGE